MKEIKFRCWYDNKMHKVEDISFKHKTINLFAADIINFRDGILMQYTGLEDKNGIEIYDGDILRIDDEYWLVQYDIEDAMFTLYYDNVIENFSNMNSKWFEIIGNIYENPELFKEE